jgi:Holliday junction resolvase RusA-like endonuclease
MKSEFVLKGRPITKKNHQRVIPAVSKTGATYHRPIQSESYQNYEIDCLWQLKSYQGPKFTGKVNLKCIYWMKDFSSWPDLIGLLQATGDILQKSGVIANDRNIISLDGSKIAGVDGKNPRVEISLEDIEN